MGSCACTLAAGLRYILKLINWNFYALILTMLQSNTSITLDKGVVRSECVIYSSKIVNWLFNYLIFSRVFSVSFLLRAACWLLLVVWFLKAIVDEFFIKVYCTAMSFINSFLSSQCSSHAIYLLLLLSFHAWCRNKPEYIALLNMRTCRSFVVSSSPYLDHLKRIGN